MKEAKAATAKWNMDVDIRAVLHLNQIEETFVDQEVFLSQTFV